MRNKILGLIAMGLLSIGLLAVPMVAVNAAVLVIDSNGLLTGARGVNILGALYDVDFQRGLCSTFYGDCGPGGNFGDMYQLPDPERLQFAAQASYALLDQVLVGDYDLDAGLTFGCAQTVAVTHGRCYILTPYWWQNIDMYAPSGMVYMVAVNGSVLAEDIWHLRIFSNHDEVLNSINMGNWHPNPLTDGGIDPASSWSVWAVWRPATSVPEPGTLALLGLGLLGLGFSRRRKLN